VHKAHSIQIRYASKGAQQGDRCTESYSPLASGAGMLSLWVERLLCSLFGATLPVREMR
jgi:hypothetical protein